MSLKPFSCRLGEIENVGSSATTYPADIRKWTDEQLIEYGGKGWAAKLEGIMLEEFGIEYSHSDKTTFTDEQLELIAMH